MKCKNLEPVSWFVQGAVHLIFKRAISEVQDTVLRQCCVPRHTIRSVASMVTQP